MTYKLDPSLSRITSPVLLILPNGEAKEYKNGALVIRDVFDQKYSVADMKAVGDVVVITLSYAEMDCVNWVNEEQTFF